jgi:hypothetical protein
MSRAHYSTLLYSFLTLDIRFQSGTAITIIALEVEEIAVVEKPE